MLMIVTIAAAALAVGLAFYAWHLAQRERLRSNARVAALAAAIEGTSTGDGPATMFREAGATAQGRPLLKVAIGFAMAVFVIVVIAMTVDRPATAPSGAGIEGSVAQQQSLELLSMRHERTGEALTVTGLVRNPGPPAAGDIIAVVLTFDRDGGFIASGRAPLEFGRIAAGDESPFRVIVPGVRDVGRYRVSFRTDNGVVRHVDRRPSSSGLVSGRPAPGVSRPMLAAAN